jgi:hypothetical protein
MRWTREDPSRHPRFPGFFFSAFMHGQGIGFNQTLGIAIAYLAVATILFAFANFAGLSAANWNMRPPMRKRSTFPNL